MGVPTPGKKLPTTLMIFQSTIKKLEEKLSSFSLLS
jgi:hypothetical protein